MRFGDIFFRDFIEYMKKKAPDAVDPYGCLEYAYGEDD